LSTTKPTCCTDSKPDRRRGKPSTNRLSYGTAFECDCYCVLIMRLVSVRNMFLVLRCFSRISDSPDVPHTETSLFAADTTFLFTNTAPVLQCRNFSDTHHF
jgi:hypothetical protein